MTARFSGTASNSDSLKDVRLDRPRWTHMALIVKDMEASIAWYEKFTHLRLFKRHEDESGYGAWLVDPEQPDPPFILVLAEFFDGKDPFAPTPHHPIGPFAHFGIELTSRKAVDDLASFGREHNCLAHGPVKMPAPIGYICFLTDPDGNTIEFSYGQGVYEAVREEWDIWNKRR